MSFDKMFSNMTQVPQIQNTPGMGNGSPLKRSNGDQPSFSDKMSDAIRNVDKSQFHADDKLRQLASGKNVDIHGTMIAMEEADITLRTMTSVRDKVVDAYQKLMNMNI
jgi:flagellar hook-basal body complex protein FliE